MCQIGQGSIDAATNAQNVFTAIVVEHQDDSGLGASIENPKGSSIVKQPAIVKVCGTPETPKPRWSFYRSEGCQLRVVYPGRDDPGRPIQKACYWISNFDLSALEVRCRKPAALLATTHEHRHARGSMYVEGEGSRSVANYTGKYTPEQSSVYGKSCRMFCETASRQNKILDSRLKRLADQSSVVKGDQDRKDCSRIGTMHGTKQFLLSQDDRCFDISGEEHRDSPLQPCEPGLAPAAGARVGSLKPVDQYHKVTGHPGDSAVDSKDISRSSEAEAQARKEDAAHDKNVQIAEIFWSG